MKKVVTTTYIAEDGTVFNNEIQCREYEEKSKELIYSEYMTLFDHKKNPISWERAKCADFDIVYMVYLKKDWKDFEDNKEVEYGLADILPSDLWELLWEQGWYIKIVESDEGWVKWNELKQGVARYAELIGEG